MNLRVKELYKQASKQEYFLRDGEEVYMSAEDLKKFAELLVKECAGIYSKIDNGNQHLGTDDYLEALHKHFGVE